MDPILGYNSCPWVVVVIMEDVKLFLKGLVIVIVQDVKLFLEDHPHVSVYWISRLDNMVTYKSVQWIYNVIMSDLGLNFKFLHQLMWSIIINSFLFNICLFLSSKRERETERERKEVERKIT